MVTVKETSEFTLERAHKTAVRHLELARQLHDLVNVVRFESIAPSDVRLADFDRLATQLRGALSDAEKALVPHLGEFACVNDRPVEVNGFTVASAHHAAQKVAEWAAAGWATERIVAFLRRSYDPATKSIDWRQVWAREPETCMHFGSNDRLEHWREHHALLDIEYAKAARRPKVSRDNFWNLSYDDRCVVEALGNSTMSYRELAQKAGFKANSNFRGRLSKLVKGGVLERAEGGYRRGPLLRD